MTRQRRAAPGTVREYFISFIDKVTFEEIIENPPNRFNIFVLICYVRVVQIEPETDTFGQDVPILFIPKYLFSAFFIKLVDSVFYDFFLAVEVKFFFDFDLDRQPVRIPSGFSFDAVTLHNFEPANKVFYGS